MLELFVYLLCGSILVSGILAVRLGQQPGGGGQRRARESVRRGLLRPAGRTGRRNDGGLDRFRLGRPHFSLCNPPDDGESTMIESIGSLLVLLGAIFHFSAGLGMLRMPDAYTRMQAGTKASTLGNALVLAGLAIYHPGWGLKLFIIVYFVLMTNPVSSHALARAAHGIRIPMAGDTDIDALRDAQRKAGGSM